MAVSRGIWGQPTEWQVTQLSGDVFKAQSSDLAVELVRTVRPTQRQDSLFGQVIPLPGQRTDYLGPLNRNYPSETGPNYVLVRYFDIRISFSRIWLNWFVLPTGLAYEAKAGIICFSVESEVARNALDNAEYGSAFVTPSSYEYIVSRAFTQPAASIVAQPARAPNYRPEGVAFTADNRGQVLQITNAPVVEPFVVVDGIKNSTGDGIGSEYSSIMSETDRNKKRILSPQDWITVIIQSPSFALNGTANIPINNDRADWGISYHIEILYSANYESLIPYFSL